MTLDIGCLNNPFCFLKFKVLKKSFSIKGKVVKSFQSPSPAVCLEKCKNNKLCNWYSYAEEFKLCMLLEDCRNLDENQPKFESGQKDCPLPFPAGENFKIFEFLKSYW